MKITLSPEQLAHAIRIYTSVLLGCSLKSTTTIVINPTKNPDGSGTFNAVIDVSDKFLPVPLIEEKTITQEEVDKAYTAALTRKLDIEV